MEFIEGKSLKERLDAKGRFAISETVRIMEHACADRRTPIRGRAYGDHPQGAEHPPPRPSEISAAPRSPAPPAASPCRGGALSPPCRHASDRSLSPCRSA